jgi:hypothetical protein
VAKTRTFGAHDGRACGCRDLVGGIVDVLSSPCPKFFLENPYIWARQIGRCHLHVGLPC